MGLTLIGALHLRATTTEGNYPLENNSIKERCANCSESNAVARYSAELDAPCRPSGGSWVPGTTDTYVHDDRGSQYVIFDHLQYITKVKINVEPEHEDLPSFYWLPKLHKNPYEKRFIAASN